jgi:hypothetical protein
MGQAATCHHRFVKSFIFAVIILTTGKLIEHSATIYVIP